MFAVRSHHPDLLYRLRSQLGGGLLFGALLPYLLRWMSLSSTDFLLPLHISLAGNVLAILAGTWLFRSVTTYPGAEATTYILPTFSMAYGALLIALILSRLDYNRLVLLGGYTLALTWFYVVIVLLQRRQQFKIGVVPFGDLAALPESDAVLWIRLENADVSPPWLDAVTADLRCDLPDEWDRRLSDFALAGVPVYHVKHLVESLTGRVELEHLSENSFGSLTPVSAYMSLKHTADWFAALVLAIVLAPVLLVVALAVRISSPGPVLFQQVRVGFRGKPFTVIKFRTMRTMDQVATDARQAAITREGDVRITPLGRFLRRSRLDELPQIINVLRGEMSWIGPRPEAAVLSRWYEEEIPFYRYRHIVRPGIAGWAQVCQGHVAAVDEVKSKLYYDFYYIKHYSLWLDLLIVFRTIRTMISGFGSK